MPRSCLLVETDSPVLGPSADERNEPANIAISIKAIAELKDVDEAEIIEAAMEKQPGTYALILIPNSSKPVKIGKLGMLQVRAGYYIYVGSAFGPGGLRARIAHHTKISNRPRWHIDYLRTVTHLRELWYTYDPRSREHQWADIIAGVRGITVPFPGFGSSDCNCKSHLYFLKSKPTIESFRRRVRASIEDHEKVLIEKIIG